MKTCYEWHGVLAGAYLTEKAMAKQVSHLVALDEKGDTVWSGTTLCGRIETDRVSDMIDTSSRHCPACERKAAKLQVEIRS